MAGKVLSQQQEDFCLHMVSGLSQGESYRKAYAINPWTDRSITDSNASALVRTSKILERITELREPKAKALIAGIDERKEILSRIIRGDQPSSTQEKSQAGMETIITKNNNPVPAMSELNKMDHVYEPATGVSVDNRTINILVVDKETKQLMERVRSGEGTENLIEDDKTEGTEDY